MSEIYLKNDIDEILRCKNCKKLYDKPLILPCFRKICAQCVKKLMEKHHKFACPFCDKKHCPPTDGGFLVDDELMQLISKKCTKMYRNSWLKQLDDLKIELQSYDKTIDRKEKSLESDLNEYCRLVRNKIDLAVEETIMRIDKIRNDHFKIIDDYETTCLAGIKTNNRSAIVEFKNEVNSFLDEITQSLNDPLIGEKESRSKFEQARLRATHIGEVVQNLDFFVHDQQRVDFESNENLLGQMVQYPVENPLTSNNIKNVIGISQESLLNVWNVASEMCDRTLETGWVCISCVTVVDNAKIVGAGNRTLKVWDVNTGECTRTMQGHDRSITCLSVVDNCRLVSGAVDFTLKVWDVNRGESTQTLKGHSSVVTCVSVMDERTIVSGSFDKTIKVWDLVSGNCNRTIDHQSVPLICVALRAKWKIVSGGESSTMKVWNVETGECVARLKGHSDRITTLDVVDNSTVLSGSRDATLRLWNVDTGKCLRTLRGHSSWINYLRVLDDCRVVTASNDTTLKVWDINTGRCIQSIGGHSRWIKCVSVIHHPVTKHHLKSKAVKDVNNNLASCLSESSSNEDNEEEKDKTDGIVAEIAFADLKKLK